MEGVGPLVAVGVGTRLGAAVEVGAGESAAAGVAGRRDAAGVEARRVTVCTGADGCCGGGDARLAPGGVLGLCCLR